MKNGCAVGYVLVIVAGFIGCAGSSVASEEVVLTLWIQDDESGFMLQFMHEKIEQYLIDKKKLRIELLRKDGDTLREEFRSASLGGTSPELLMVASDNVGSFVAAGFIRPVDDLYVAIDYIESIKSEGKTWGVPVFSGKHLMLLYNKSIISRAPSGFEELIEVAQGLTDGETYGLVYNASEPFWLIPFLSGFGGGVFALDGVTPTLNTLEMVRALEFMASLKFEYQITPSESDYGDMDRLFKEGKAAFIINGDWSLDDYRTALGRNLGVANLPILPGGGVPRPYASSTYFVVAEAVDSSECQSIIDFIAYFTSDEVLLEAVAELGLLPASLSALSSEKLTEDPVLKASALQLVVSIPQPSVPEMRANWDAIRFEQNKVFAGAITPEEAAEAMQIAAEYGIKNMQ